MSKLTNYFSKLPEWSDLNSPSDLNDAAVYSHGHNPLFEGFQDLSNKWGAPTWAQHSIGAAFGDPAYDYAHLREEGVSAKKAGRVTTGNVGREIAGYYAIADVIPALYSLFAGGGGSAAGSTAGGGVGAAGEGGVATGGANVAGEASGIYTTPTAGTAQGSGLTGTPVATAIGGGTTGSLLSKLLKGGGGLGGGGDQGGQGSSPGADYMAQTNKFPNFGGSDNGGNNRQRPMTLLELLRARPAYLYGAGR